MKVTSSLQTASQWLAVRLYTRGASRADRQRGASALEYIVLAVAIVIVVATGAALLSPEITAAFDDLVTGITAPAPAS